MERYRAGDGCLASPACGIGLAPCPIVKLRLIPVAAKVSPRLNHQFCNPILALPPCNAPVHMHKSLSDRSVPTGVGACAEVGSRSTAKADKRRLPKGSP
jgi:hypothetical protein